MTKSGISSNSAWRVHFGRTVVWSEIKSFGWCRQDFSVTRAWQKCENTRSISFCQFQYLSIVLEGQKIYQFVEYIFSSLAIYFILQIVKSLWPCSLYDQMCENTPSVIVALICTTLKSTWFFQKQKFWPQPFAKSASVQGQWDDNSTQNRLYAFAFLVM